MNNHKLKPGLAILGAAVGLASVAGIAQDNADLDRKLRELNIMSNIFQAAMEQGGDSRVGMGRAGRPDSMYLAGQGMVFSFRLMNNRPVRIQGGNFDQGWLQHMQETLDRTAESLKRVQLSFPDLDFDFDFDFDYDFDDNNSQVFIRGGQGVPQPARVFFYGGGGGPEREAAREMEEAMRDTQQQIREQQREVSRLEREIRNSENANTQNLQVRIDELEAGTESGMARLDEQRQAYETFLNDLDTARQEQQLALADEASNQIITTLCDYGATLRSLGNNEHVTLILEDVVDDNDQVYVFKYSDISDCRSPETLKQSAVSYQLQ